jgi:hypothetical protein
MAVTKIFPLLPACKDIPCALNDASSGAEIEHQLAALDELKHIL